MSGVLIWELPVLNSFIPSPSPGRRRLLPDAKVALWRLFLAIDCMVGFVWKVCFCEKRLFCFRKLLDESPCFLVSRGRVAYFAPPVAGFSFLFLLYKTAKVPPSVRKNFSQMITFLISSQESVPSHSCRGFFVSTERLCPINLEQVCLC